jgi:ABC-type cobalamin/Fe3+-siderophores transport system ATPase subunit
VQLEIWNLTFQYSDYPVLEEISFQVGSGRLVGLVGPNGSGKSTLLQLISRSLAPTKGQVLLDGTPIEKINRKELARMLSVVSQSETCAFDFTVAEVVQLGRLPYLGPFGKEKVNDGTHIQKAMQDADVVHLAQRRIFELSGGEYQRVALARTLAQATPIMLLDEPTSSLDVNYQIHVLQLLKRLTAAGRAVLISLHDLNLAAQFCDRLIMLHNSRIYAEGTPESVLTAETIQTVYGIQATVAPHPVTGRPYVYPHYS